MKYMKLLDVCPICDHSVELTSEEVVRKYKGKELIIQEYFYRCGGCNYEFTTTEVDEINVETTKKEYQKMSEQLTEFIKNNIKDEQRR